MLVKRFFSRKSRLWEILYQFVDSNWVEPVISSFVSVIIQPVVVSSNNWVYAKFEWRACDVHFELNTADARERAWLIPDSALGGCSVWLRLNIWAVFKLPRERREVWICKGCLTDENSDRARLNLSWQYNVHTYRARISGEIGTKSISSRRCLYSVINHFLHSSDASGMRLRWVSIRPIWHPLCPYWATSE
jgi:hypothetical protein